MNFFAIHQPEEVKTLGGKVVQICCCGLTCWQSVLHFQKSNYSPPGLCCRVPTPGLHAAPDCTQANTFCIWKQWQCTIYVRAEPCSCCLLICGCQTNSWAGNLDIDGVGVTCLVAHLTAGLGTGERWRQESCWRTDKQSSQWTSAKISQSQRRPKLALF